MVPPGFKFKLGRRPARPGIAKLDFAKYVAKLPAPPASVRWDEKVSDWGMDGNDVYGDCVEAAKAHVVQSNTANAGSEVDAPASQVVADYFAETGGVDSGLVISDSLGYWVSNGFTTGVASDPTDTLDAYASINVGDFTTLQQAIARCQSVVGGVVLPDYILSQPLGQVWDVQVGNPPADPNNGHCVPFLGYDGTYYYIVTWGTVTPVTPSFIQTYFDELWVPLDFDVIAPGGTSPAGLDTTQLQSDFSNITQGQPTPPTPPPSTCVDYLQAAVTDFNTGQYVAGIEQVFEYLDCLIETDVVSAEEVVTDKLRAFVDRIRKHL